MAMLFTSFWFDTGSAQNLVSAPQQDTSGVGTSIDLSLAVFQNRLYAAWNGVNDDQGIWWSPISPAAAPPPPAYCVICDDGSRQCFRDESEDKNKEKANELCAKHNGIKGTSE